MSALRALSGRPRPASAAPASAARDADAIASARALTEERFAAVGRNLEESTTILARLTEAFGSLETELESDALKQASRELSGAADALTRLSEDYREERRAIARLAEAGVGMSGRVGRMHKAVKAVDVLGISARIEAVHLGSAGSDFLAFAEEIDRSLDVAQASLAELARDIAGVCGHLEEADAVECDFDARHGEALRVVPARLAAGVEAIAGQRRRAATAASAVAERSRQVAARVGDAVMALQIGDITRQRIEHVEAAMARLERLEGDAARRGVAALGLRVQSAQLEDAAADLEREAERIVVSLRQLIASAGAIAAAGEQAGAGGGRRAFMLDLEEQVAEARALLEGFTTARGNADRVVEAVRNAATRLAGRLDAIRELEDDMRIMGLNTTLKCSRLGTAGRPLAVVAQELRVCADETGAEAEAVMEGLERLTGETADLSDAAQDRHAAIVQVATVLGNSVDRLASVGECLADALASLGRDSESVGGLLAGTVKEMTVHGEVAGVLRDAAAALAERAAAAERMAGGRRRAAELPPEDRKVLDEIAGRYTMAQERQIHARVLGVAPAEPPAQASTRSAVDDFLF